MATLKDVAARAGVSVMTVSNVVNDRVVVAEATRIRVLEAIDEVGYRPNISARSLARGRSGIISLALPDISIPYFAELAASFMRVAAESGQRVLVEQTGGEDDRERAIVSGDAPLLGDALVLYPTRLDESDLAHPALPTVLLGGAPGMDGPPRVVIDNDSAARQVVERLVADGRSRIALVGPLHEPVGSAAAHRVAGYRAALEASGLVDDLLVDARSYHREDGHAATLQVLDRRPDAIFCLSDQIASGALRALRERGLVVPDDVAVIGFDDIDEAGYLAPPLTTVHVDRDGVARTALELVRSLLAGDAPAGATTITHRLVVRESAR